VEDLIGISGGEWVADWYAPDYYSMADSTNNPSGVSTGEQKVQRGGLGTLIVKWGVTKRYSTNPLISLGAFRCAYTPPGTH
jgi:hypothetical protein